MCIIGWSCRVQWWYRILEWWLILNETGMNSLSVNEEPRRMRATSCVLDEIKMVQTFTVVQSRARLSSRSKSKRSVKLNSGLFQRLQLDNMRQARRQCSVMHRIDLMTNSIHRCQPSRLLVYSHTRRAPSHHKRLTWQSYHVTRSNNNDKNWW